MILSGVSRPGRSTGTRRIARTIRGKTKAELIGRWSAYRVAYGAEKDSLILAHTRADVREPNSGARATLNERGELGEEVRVEVAREVMAEDGMVFVERGERLFAVGDRVMFLKNDRELA